jgi:hypothetical protein
MAGQLTPGRCDHQREQVLLQPQHQHLAFRIAEAGVVFDQPLNIPAAFLCIGVWAAASAVLANVALVRRK